MALIQKFAPPQSPAEALRIIFLLLYEGLEPFFNSVTENPGQIDLEPGIECGDFGNLHVVLMDSREWLHYRQLLESNPLPAEDQEDEDEDEDLDPIEFSVN